MTRNGFVKQFRYSLGPDLCSENTGTRTCTFGSVHTHTHTHTHTRARARAIACMRKYIAAVIGVVFYTFAKGEVIIVKPRSDICCISKQVTQRLTHHGRFPAM